MPTRSISTACTGSTTCNAHGPGRHARARRAARGADRREGAHRRGARRAVPDDPRAQGAGRLRLPGAAPGRRAASIPTRQRAVWPSTGNYCRGGVAISRILGCRGVAVLPGGHEPGALRLAGPMGERARGHRAHAGHRVQRQGDLRQVRRAGARSGQRDRQPVQRVRQLPGALALHRAGAGAASSRRCARHRATCGLPASSRPAARRARWPPATISRTSTAPRSPWSRRSSARRCS